MGRISMRKISEVLRQKFQLELTNRTIANSLGISPGTVSDYVTRAQAASISWPLPEGITEQELYNLLFLPANAAHKDRVEPDWQYIHTELRKKGMTLQLLWREYRQQHKNGLGYSQFCRIYQQNKKALNPVMRQVHKAGEKCFVDYAGMTVDWLNVITGEIHKAQIFVGCMGASQLIFAQATASQQLPDWINSHVHMFEYFGGIPEIVVPDNLRSGVTKAHRYDPDINYNYQHLAEHYGIAVVPARVVRPKDKAKAENAVGIIERQILAPIRNMTFSSVGEIDAEIKKRTAILNNQQFQKMTTSRRELFEQIDKPALKPLPASRYQYADWIKAKVNIDYHVEFAKSFYSVPYQYIGKYIQVRGTNKTVECFYDNQRIATHVREYKKYKFTTEASHMPKNHQEHADMSIGRLKNWASNIGINTVKFIDYMIKSRAFPQQAFRACLGLLRLGKKYGDTRLENACRKALLTGATRYQHVESILKNNLEEVAINNEQIDTPLIVHKNIRGPDYYQ